MWNPGVNSALETDGGSHRQGAAPPGGQREHDRHCRRVAVAVAVAAGGGVGDGSQCPRLALVTNTGWFLLLSF